MTRPLDRHLDSDELDALVALPTPDVCVSGRLSEDALREAQRHVEICQDCDRKAQMHRSVQSAISPRALTGQAAKSPNCSDETEWARVAAGLLEATEARERMNHAAQCGHCGPLLKAAVQILSDETTPAEDAAVANLTSARPEWQVQMAHALKRSSEPGPMKEKTSSFWSSLFFKPHLSFAVAAVAIFVAAVWIGLRTLRPPSADQLLAQAYTERRTVEVRIPGAKYAPLRVERGRSQSSFDKPDSLLKAEALIGENLRQKPNAAEWLQARARADLLDGSYDDAITILQRALESKPESPELLTDLGSAYFLRAKSAVSPVDYANAVEALGRALARNPDDPVALFNRALACGEVSLYTQAVDDWQHYLRLDPQGEWADEARRRLAEVLDKVRRREQSRADPLAIPVHGFADPDDPPTSQVGPSLEEYLDLALTDWLPKMFAAQAASEPGQHKEDQALQVLSNVMIRQKGDSWLSDMLARTNSQDFTKAAGELSEAILANDRADTKKARMAAERAAYLFARSHNGAGWLRARIETLTALNSGEDGPGCDRLAKSLTELVRNHPYPWLQARIEFESGDCGWQREDLGSARLGYIAASKDAKAHGLQLLSLHAQERLAGLDAVSGAFDSGWKGAAQGLATFWSGNYPDVHGYNFYFSIYELTRLAGLPHAQVAAWRDGIRLTESSPDIAQRAMAHLAMGNAAEKARMFELSAAAFAQADKLFSESPQIPSTRMAQLEAETRLAAVETSTGNAQQALARMKPLRLEIDELSNNYLSILFYSTLGEAESLGASSDEAENDLWKAVRLSQRQVSSIRNAKSRFQVVRQSSTAYRLLVQRVLLDGDPEEALLLWESYRAAPLGQGRGNGRRPEDSAALGTLHNLGTLNNQTVVSYALLPQGLAIWIIDDRGIFSHWADGNGAVVAAAAVRMRSLCADPTSDPADLLANARLLYDALISPIREHLASGRTLIVELDDDLEGLPIEALVDQHGQYLGATTIVSNSLGLGYRAKSRLALPISRDVPALIVGVSTANPELGISLTPLPDTLEEADAVGIGFAHASVLKAGLATRQSVLASLPSARLFHFAGHAIHTSDEAGVVLFDSLLTPQSIPQSSLSQLQLAVLSGCETGNGLRSAMNDADSLVRAFVQAGVPEVVASRWKVDSVATRRFMTLFYADLLDGNSVSMALHRAQSELRSDPNMSHPYYWSAFGMFGGN